MGQHEYELKSLADEQLLLGLASIVGQRNKITTEFLAYLAELDQRQLFLDLGYSSLFEYCVEKLGLCESTAGRHIAAARVCRNHPEGFAMVASGTLHASALSLMRKYVTAENAAELFELCSRRSARKVEALLAARFPRPDVRDLIRRLPAQTGLAPDVGSSVEHAAMEQSPEVSVELTNAPVESVSCAPSLAAEASKPRRFEPLSVDRYGVHFTADGEFCALLERVRGLAPRRVSRSVSGHRLPIGDLMTLLKRGLEAYERELEKERFAVGCKARRRREVLGAAVDEDGGPKSDVSESQVSKIELVSPNPARSEPLRKLISNPIRRRRYSAEVRRAVYARDGKQCSYVSPDGRRCCSRRCLEFDHMVPLAAGGDDTTDNLRLRCRAHNQRYARQCFGRPRIDEAVRGARRQRRVCRTARQAWCRGSISRGRK
jgi:hypothetical protein